MAEVDIGRVSDYYVRIGVAGIELTGELCVGDRIHIKGHTTDLTLAVESMEIEREAVERAGADDAIGIKVAERCRTGDQVFKVTDERE